MSSVDGLLRAYRRQVALPWERNLAPAQRVWMAVYEPTLERRLRPRIEDFEEETHKAGHTWALVDVTDSFARWMAGQEYREAYFEQPGDMEFALDEFRDFVSNEVRDALTAPDVDENTVVGVIGVASLFGLTRTSAVIDGVSRSIRGRLLVFFPGQRDGNNYRLLDARDGWNYLALAIESSD